MVLLLDQRFHSRTRGGAMKNLKTASILLAPIGKAIMFVDAVAANPEKWKYVIAESFKNMLALILCLVIWIFRCFLQSINTFLPSSVSTKALADIIVNTTEKAEEDVASSNPLAGSAIGRAFSQVLALMNETPVSSRKYEFVRDLAEKMIDENSKVGSAAVREVNRMAFSAGFRRTLRLLTSSLRGHHAGGLTTKLLRRIPLYGHVAPRASRALGFLSNNLPRLQPSDGDAESASFAPTTATAAESVLAEKLAAELLWLAQKLAECGAVEEALLQWSDAAILASLSVSAHPRVQVSLVRVSVFLFKEIAKADVEATKVKMLMRWLPFFSYATNGVESLVLSSAEKADVERLLESTIEGLDDMKDKEMVLSNWLDHYMHCPSSEWPNLGKCYRHWCSLSISTLS